jgi:hypothetical protein
MGRRRRRRKSLSSSWITAGSRTRSRLMRRRWSGHVKMKARK